MTTLFRSRRRAEQFAALVDGTTSLRPGSALAADAATQGLVGVVDLLRREGAADPDAVPSGEFVADLRERLMAEAVTVLTPRNAGLALPVRARGPRERRLVAIASAAVLIGGTAGLATAAQGSLPGEALYPLKRGIEKVEVGMSPSRTGRGHDLLDQASGRLGETQGLLDQRSATGTPQVSHTLDTFVTQAQQGADLLMSSYQDGGDPADIAAVRDFAASGLRTVAAMSGTAPPEALPGLRNAALTLRAIDGRARGLCETCDDLPPLSLPPVFLASAEASRAIHRLQNAHLDNSHPVIANRDAVRQASAPRRAAGPGQIAGGHPAAPTTPLAPIGKAPLPGLPSSVPTPRVKIRVDLGGTHLGDGLGDTVETLLPDPTDLLP